MLKDLKISQKLGLATGALAVPLLLGAVVVLKNGFADVSETRQEKAGLVYLTLARQTLERTLDYTGYAALGAAEGDVERYRSRLTELNGSLRKDLADPNAPESRLREANADVDLLSRMNAAQRLGEMRRVLVEEMAPDPPVASVERLRPFADLSRRIVDFQRTVGEQSGLMTESSVAMALIVRPLLDEMPEAADAIGRLRALTVIASGKRRVDTRELAQMEALTGTLRNYSQRIQRSIASAAANNPALATEISSKAEGLARQATTYADWVTTNYINANAVTTTPATAFNTATGNYNEFFAQYDGLLKAASAGLDDRLTTLNRDQMGLLGALAIGLLGVGYVVVKVNVGLASQVTAMQRVFARISGGDLSARADVRSKDELGQLAERLNTVLNDLTRLVQSQEDKDRIQGSIRRLLEEVSVVAEGDLRAEAAVTADITGAIADSFNYMISELRQIISAVQRTTLDVTAQATEVQQTAAQLAQGSEAQATQIVRATAAIDEMAQAIQQVSANAGTASLIAEQALRNAKQGAQSVQQTIQGMNQIRNQVQNTSKRIKRLGESSQEIGEIVQLISDIADRTSILALNASIQAAMAGEAGKGFAIVAEEVERLAERSTEATKRIATLIRSIQSDTNEAISAMEETTREVVGGSDLANAAGQTLTQIESVSNQLAEVIQSISAAARAQSRGSESVVRSMTDISQVTQQTASGAKQAADSIRRLAEQAENLRESLRRFRLPEEKQAAAATVTGQWAAFVSR